MIDLSIKNDFKFFFLFFGRIFYSHLKEWSKFVATQFISELNVFKLPFYLASIRIKFDLICLKWEKEKGYYKSIFFWIKFFGAQFRSTYEQRMMENKEGNNEFYSGNSF